MLYRVIRPLKALLVVLILIAAGVQLLVPVAAAQAADNYPGLAYLAVPYSVTLIAIVACGQVAAACIWPLLTHVGKESLFADDTFRWVNVVIYAGGVATLLSAALSVHVFIVVGTGPITLPMGLLGMTVGTAAFTLLMLVMRGLLRSAVAMRRDLEGVI